jgi:hypothetical protein
MKPKPPSLFDWVLQTEESVATMLANRGELDREIVEKRMVYEEGLQQRALDQPGETTLPSPTTTLGQLARTIAALENRRDNLNAEILRRQSMLDEKKRELLLEEEEAERRACIAALRQADKDVYEKLSQLREAWDAYIPTLERVDRCETAEPTITVYKHLERLIADSFVAWKPTQAATSRVNALTDEGRRRTQGGLGEYQSQFAPDGFRVASGWGGHA